MLNALPHSKSDSNSPNESKDASFRRVAFAKDSNRRLYGLERSSMRQLPEDFVASELEDFSERKEEVDAYDVVRGDVESDLQKRNHRSRLDSQGGESSKASEGFTASDASFNEDDSEAGHDREDVNDSNGSIPMESRVPLVVFGYRLPSWMNKRPSWNRIAGFIVTRAPCFWCYGFTQPTDREILARLNLLSCFIAVLQMASCVWLGWVSLSDGLVDRSVDVTENLGTNETIPADSQQRIQIILNFWNLNGAVYGLGILAFIIFVSAIMTVRVIQNVNLMGAIRYLWVLLWMAPFEILFVIGLFDYFRVTDVWIKHWWRDKAMAWFRYFFCSPQESFNTLCAVPLMSLAEEVDWCLFQYNSTACTGIRNRAQSNMEQWMLAYYWINAGVGLVLICLLLLNINTLEGIISRPLVQKSRESNVPAWLALPTFGSFVIGYVFGYAESSGLSTETQTQASFLGPLFLSLGGMFLVLALLGWGISAYSILNTRDKRRKLIMIFLFVFIAGVIVILLATAFATSIAFSISLRAIPISESERGRIACFLDQTESCTDCDLVDPRKRCPEWSVVDVTRIIQSQAKSAATLAAIFILYAISALRFGVGLRKHVTMYQIDYV